MIRENENTQMYPESILQQVDTVQRSKQSRDQKFALLVGAAVLAVMMLVAMFIESQLNLFSYTLRFGLTLLTLAATVVCAWKLWSRAKQNNERLVSAAKDIDELHPSFEQRVSTLTSCREEQLAKNRLVHPAMMNRLTEETATIHQRVEPKPIVSYQIYKLPLMCLAGAALILVGLFVWDAPKTLVQLGRFCAPWSNLSTTNVTADQADHVAARNEPLKLTASLAGRPVDEVMFLSKNLDGSEPSTTQLWPSTKDHTVASLRQSKAVDSFDYKFRAGDGQTDWHRVIVADRPKIKDLTMRIVPPEYTGKSTRTFQRLPKKLRVVSGSRLEVEVKPKLGIRNARLVMGKTDWVPMELASDGRYEGVVDLRQPVKFKVQLTEMHGLVNRRAPGCELKVVADAAPKVKILKPTKTTVLLPDEAIDIHFKATDDHGIKKMALRVYLQREGEAQPTLYEEAIPIDSESNNRKIRDSVTLDLDQFNLKDGDSIRYEIRASDNFRPLEDLADQTEAELHPMKDVELTQAETRREANDIAAASVPSKNQGPASSTAQGNPKAASSADASAAKPSDEKTSAASSNAVAESNSTPASESKAEQSPNNQTAAASSEDSRTDTAVNENAVQAATPERGDTAKDSGSSAIANSDRSMEQDTTANATPSSASASSAPSSSSAAAKQNASPSQPSQSNQSSQGNQSQQASSPQKSSDSSSSSQAEKKLATNKREQPDPAEDAEDRTPPAEAPVEMAESSPEDGVGQSSSSGQQQIKVDKYAGGFTSEHRQELEIAVSPILELLKESLTSAGKSVRKVMADPTNGPSSDAALSSAADDLGVVSESVFELNEKTRNTPYVFVGLRLESIRLADVAPATEEVQKAIDAQDGPRLEHSHTAWYHISQALASLEKLEEKYEQVKRDLQRADDILRFKKMHRIFIEKSLTMLNPKDSTINGQSRKGAEYDLDEEYLKRLKEVMKMRRDMMAELARILGDDPQLLRRYMNQMNKRTSTIRDQLTFVARDQEDLSLRVSKWSDSSQKPAELAKHQEEALADHLAEVEEVFNRYADVQNEFISWLPLVEDGHKGDVAQTLANFKAAGSGLTEILADVQAIFVAGVAQPDASRQIDPLLSKSTKIERKLTTVAKSLRQLNSDSSDPEIVNNTARRIPELQTVQRDMQLWAGKLELLKDGLVHESYSVDQENRREQLLEFTVKIASLESQLVAALQSEDGQLPAGVAKKTKELQKLLDSEIPGSQLLAAQSLLDAKAARAKLEQQEITDDFTKAEKKFDEILQAIADELDKLPPEDPIAALLRDPTLDEILLELEREQDFLEALGLSARPSNLQAMSSWRRMQGMQAQMQNMRQLSNTAYRNALARTRVKAKFKKRKRAKDDSRWNVVVGKLKEDMLQGDNKTPPERYRSAIQQYTDQISKLKNGQEESD